MWKSEILSPAKINVHLDVAAPGENGFHPLRSLFLMVSLYDRLTVSERSDGCTIQSNCPFPAKENILYKTWDLCRSRGFYDGGLEIVLEKTIPSGAGLGGGSGDCASLLRLLEGHSEKGIPPGEWRDLGAELGSDVPFFMDTVAAVVTGRGEHIRAVPARTDFQILVVYPDLPLSTPAAFKALDNFREARGIGHEWGLGCDEMARIFREVPPGAWPFFNSFADATFKDHPQLARIEEKLLTCGADFVTLSGSGSAMAGIFTDSESLKEAQILLKRKFPATYAVTPLDIIPYGIVI